MAIHDDLTTIFHDGLLVDLTIGYWAARSRNTSTELGLEETSLPDYVISLGNKRLIQKTLSTNGIILISGQENISRNIPSPSPLAPLNSFPYPSSLKLSPNSNGSKPNS